MLRILIIVTLVAIASAMPIERQMRQELHHHHHNESQGPVPNSVLGVDVSQPTGLTAFKCLKENGHHFAIVRGYQSIGRADPNARATITNAWAAGMSHVDVYLFPCVRCGNAANQVKAMVDNLKDVKYGMIWIDVEGSWGSESSNRAFFTELAEASRHAKSTGVYTSQYQWSSIMGSWDGGKDYPLWYAHYDDNPSFSDFQAFGGWSRPHVKQYEGDKFLCGAGVDLNYEPGI